MARGFWQSSVAMITSSESAVEVKQAEPSPGSCSAPPHLSQTSTLLSALELCNWTFWFVGASRWHWENCSPAWALTCLGSECETHGLDKSLAHELPLWSYLLIQRCENSKKRSGSNGTACGTETARAPPGPLRLHKYWLWQKLLTKPWVFFFSVSSRVGSLS